MDHISILKDIGKDKTCAIIGGGLSMLKMDLTMIPNMWDIISVNNHRNDLADMIIYYDARMQKHFSEHGILPTQRLIAHRNGDVDHTCQYCTHYYNFTDCEHGDTGFRAIQFADKIFNYSTIYLFGFDYKHNGKSYHFEEEESVEVDAGKKMIDRFTEYSINIILPNYSRMKYTNTIINCNTESALNVFPKTNQFLTNGLK